jgi:hypothetical protein
VPIWAVVASDGTLVRGNGVTSATRVGVGSYRLVTAQDVSNCGWVAQIASVGTEGGNPGTIRTDLSTTDPKALDVATYIDTHTPVAADLSFHMQVSC